MTYTLKDLGCYKEKNEHALCVTQTINWKYRLQWNSMNFILINLKFKSFNF